MEVDCTPCAEADPGAPFPRDHLVRVILRSLADMGHSTSVAALEAESGCRLEAAEMTAFREAVRNGEWRRCMDLLTVVEFPSREARERARALLLKQQYLELLEARCFEDALNCMRTQLTPAAMPPEELHALAALLMCPDVHSLRQMSGWHGTRDEPLQELRKLASPAQFVPHGRLETLVGQALRHQSSHCIFHNTAEDELSLYEDHHCDNNLIPHVNQRVLTEHTDEVWYVAFSHDGRLLASAAADKTIIIWDIHTPGAPALQTLKGHQTTPHMVAWSPDDSSLLSCGERTKIRRWHPRAGKLLATHDEHTEPVTAVAWVPGGQHFVSGALDRNIILWSVDGDVLCLWRDVQRIHSLCIPSNAGIDQSGRIRFYALCAGNSVRALSLDLNLASFATNDGSGAYNCAAIGGSGGGSGRSGAGSGGSGPGQQIGGGGGSGSPSGGIIAAVFDAALSEAVVADMSASSDGRHLLLPAEGGRIYLWNTAEERVATEYTGHRQKRYLVRCTFGGRGEAFVASGSEDSRVHIWHRASGHPVGVLRGHTSTVSAVAWSPTDPHLLASCSDDRTVRLWTVERSST